MVLKNKWLNRQNKDKFVKLRNANKFRSRASYKLHQINDKYDLFDKKDVVIELGSSPGGWTQVLKDIINTDIGTIIACDLNDMEPVSGVNFIKGDFNEKNIQNQIEDCLEGRGVDWVISDMAANTTGFADIDHLRTIDLAYSVLYFVKNISRLNKGVLIKIFAGSTTNQFTKELQDYFTKVRFIKPEASRAESKEVYILGLRS